MVNTTACVDVPCFFHQSIDGVSVIKSVSSSSSVKSLKSAAGSRCPGDPWSSLKLDPVAAGELGQI